MVWVEGRRKGLLGWCGLRAEGKVCLLGWCGLRAEGKEAEVESKRWAEWGWAGRGGEWEGWAERGREGMGGRRGDGLGGEERGMGWEGRRGGGEGRRGEGMLEWVELNGSR